MPDTPASTRKRVKKTLIRIAEEVDTHEYSRGSDTEEEEDEGSEDEEGPPVLRGPPGHRLGRNFATTINARFSSGI